MRSGRIVGSGGSGCVLDAVACSRSLPETAAPYLHKIAIVARFQKLRVYGRTLARPRIRARVANPAPARISQTLPVARVSGILVASPDRAVFSAPRNFRCYSVVTAASIR